MVEKNKHPTENEREGLAFAMYNMYARRGFTYDEMRQAIKRDFQEIREKIRREAVKKRLSNGGAI